MILHNHYTNLAPHGSKIQRNTERLVKALDFYEKRLTRFQKQSAARILETILIDACARVNLHAAVADR